MRSIFFAFFAIALLAVLPGQAIGAELVAGPLPVDKTSELVVGVVNTCTTQAAYKIVIKDAADGSVLRSKQGTVAAKRGVAVAYHSKTVNRNLVVANIAVTCEGGTQSRPLAGLSVRDWQTKVPRFIGDAMDGNDI